MKKVPLLFHTLGVKMTVFKVSSICLRMRKEGSDLANSLINNYTREEIFEDKGSLPAADKKPWAQKRKMSTAAILATVNAKQSE